MKTKLTVKTHTVTQVQKAADIFGVKVNREIDLNDETILTVSFRDPADLFKIGVMSCNIDLFPVTKPNAKKK